MRQKGEASFDPHRLPRAHAVMLLTSALIATSFPVVGSIAGALDSLMLTTIRFVMAIVLFTPFIALRFGRRALPDAPSLVRYTLLSAPLVGYFWAMFEALRTTSVINTAAIFTLGPFFAGILGIWIVRERLGKRRVVGLVIGMVGALWVIFRGDPSRLLALRLNGGDALFLLGTASYGLYMTLIKRLHRGEPLAVMTFWTLVTGTGWLLLMTLATPSALDFSGGSVRVFAWIAYLALFTTLITFFLTQYGTTILGPTRSMSYTFLNPALVLALTAILGRGLPEPIALPGVGLTAVAMVFLQRSQAVVAVGGGCRSDSEQADL